jgi:transposase InsO family protein
VSRLIPIARMSLRYEHHRDPQEALRVRLRELAGSRVRYGYRRLTVLLKREGWPVNAKRIYRLYTEEGLIVRTRKRTMASGRNDLLATRTKRPPAQPEWPFPFIRASYSSPDWRLKPQSPIAKARREGCGWFDAVNDEGVGVGAGRNSIWLILRFERGFSL